MKHGVRKGSWTDEEDLLLRKCISKYGEGKWHQIPLRAGLNRCRKSCRLRWLNYLHPDIKQGEFASEEIDLIVRMHRLLGNRQVCKPQWSLIAGRIPGRTANGIKNYWNSHLSKKHVPANITTTKIKAVKPEPRTFSKTSQWLRRVVTSKETKSGGMPRYSTDKLLADEDKQWWEKIVFDEETQASIFTMETREELITGDVINDPKINGDVNNDPEINGDVNNDPKIIGDVNNDPKIIGDVNVNEEGILGNWDDLYLDMNLWDFLSPEKENVNLD
ncbi:hypothetical protein GIB67_020807 [Kingdonia uniflora]|uniref:Uncharacterized protein n=1 Tax=Kingdonia uniflora TaxID=39325 RepID=A0A7J7M7H0_9MAGN|nr:hypothetical protein GIB67_020807 [Kingdonia uniflora]